MAKDFDVIEVPFREKGAPELVRRGARVRRGDAAPAAAEGADLVADA